MPGVNVYKVALHTVSSQLISPKLMSSVSFRSVTLYSNVPWTSTRMSLLLWSNVLSLMVEWCALVQCGDEDVSIVIIGGIYMLTRSNPLWAFIYILGKGLGSSTIIQCSSSCFVPKVPCSSLLMLTRAYKSGAWPSLIHSIVLWPALCRSVRFLKVLISLLDGCLKSEW